MRKDFNFAKAFEELRKITQEFESGEIDLDEGLKKFERGLELAALCRQRLKETENKIIEIKEKFAQNQKENQANKLKEQNDTNDLKEQLLNNQGSSLI
jgi:exodeoxyribonuclease VII small subunit